MSRHYKIIGFDWIAKKQLKPHPDAQLPMGQDDAAALQGSIESGGLIQPLLVLNKADRADGMFGVVDGCNRLNSDPPNGKFPCVLIDCDNVREVALECLGTGRRRSTGQRIMAYLEMHRAEVIKAAEIGAEISAGGKGPRASHSHVTARENGANLANFTSEAIAATLSVSQKDVLLGIDLLMCLERKCTAPQKAGSLVTPPRPLNLKDKADQLYYDGLKQSQASVLAGGTPIRRWKAALGGKVATADGRPEIDYFELFKEGLNHLRSASGHWDDITFEDRKKLAELASKVAEVLPTDIRNVL